MSRWVATIAVIFPPADVCRRLCSLSFLVFSWNPFADCVSRGIDRIRFSSGDLFGVVRSCYFDCVVCHRSSTLDVMSQETRGYSSTQLTARSRHIQQPASGLLKGHKTQKDPTLTLLLSGYLHSTCLFTSLRMWKCCVIIILYTNRLRRCHVTRVDQ